MAVALVLPGNWDGRRLLRFLTGLAMLAVAFVAPAPAISSSPPAVTALAQAPAETSITQREPVESAVTHGEPAAAPQAVRRAPAPLPETPAVLPVVAMVAFLLAGLPPRTRGERAPPAV